MTPGQAQWAMWLFGAACGGILGVLVFCLGAANSHSRMADRIDELRVALEDLVRQVEHDDLALPHGKGTRMHAVMKRARDVLNVQP